MLSFSLEGASHDLEQQFSLSPCYALSPRQQEESHVTAVRFCTCCHPSPRCLAEVVDMGQVVPVRFDYLHSTYRMVISWAIIHYISIPSATELSWIDSDLRSKIQVIHYCLINCVLHIHVFLCKSKQCLILCAMGHWTRRVYLLTEMQNLITNKCMSEIRVE